MEKAEDISITMISATDDDMIFGLGSDYYVYQWDWARGKWIKYIKENA